MSGHITRPHPYSEDKRHAAAYTSTSTSTQQEIKPWQTRKYSIPHLAQTGITNGGPHNGKNTPIRTDFCSSNRKGHKS